MELFDIAIIGTGPAGLSASITAKTRNKKILLIGSVDLSEKINKAHSINNYLGLPNISGEQLSIDFKRHLRDAGINIIDERVTNVYPMGDYFAIQTTNQMFQSKTVILATGVTTNKLFDNEKQLVGKGVSYCATCDALLYKGKSVAVIGYNSSEETEVEFLAEVVDKVYYFPLYSQKLENDKINLSDKIEVIYEKPISIIGNDNVEGLKTNENSYPVDGIFILRESIPPEQLVSGLKIKDNHIEVNLQMETNIKGCFACGDVAGKPYQYIKSAGQGNIAALSAVAYLSNKNND